MKDFMKGLWLMVCHVVFTLSFGTGLRYTKVIGNRGYVSNMPFGSTWLTQRSKVWRVRTKRGMKSLRKSSDIILDDSLMKSFDAVEINPRMLP